MRIRGYDLTWHPQAQQWSCACCFTITTAKQFTDEERTVRVGSRWMLWALWKSRRVASRLNQSFRAKPGERTAVGWAE